MSTRTKEEIVEAIEAAKREVKHYENRRESMCANLAMLEAELAALPAQPVELVVNIGTTDDFYWSIFAKDEHDDEGAFLVSIFLEDCKRHGIDPAHFTRFITTYPIVTELMDKTFDEHGNWKAILGSTVTHSERADLARRYHAAMKGGAA